MTELAYATLLQLRLEAARRLGCRITPLDPETGFLYELRLGESRRLLHGGLSPLNDAVAARVASDKHHTGLVLAAAGLRVPETVRCLKPGHFRTAEFDDLTGHRPARAFAREHGFPLVVKPNRGSRGLDIAVVHDDETLTAAVEHVWRRDYLALVQRPVPGIDLRIDLLDGDYLFGYLRRPVSLVGDGERTVRELLAALDPRFSGEDFERHLGSDATWIQRAPGVELEHVPAAGEGLLLATPILNLNRLCLGERLPGLAEPWLDAARRVGELMHLRHLGVDLKIADVADPLEQDPEAATVIEVNASPSLAHMSRMGFAAEALEAETRVVEAMLGLA